MIQWKAIDDPGQIERTIKMLIRRLHPTARGMDGKGGDGGVDSWMPTDLKRPVIFEIKSFTRRLSGSQRKQIEKSLANAAKFNPIVWRLIIPLEHSPAEKAWFDELQQKYPKTILVWQGVDWLDEQFARHDDLRRYVEGPDYGLLTRCKEMQLEQAALATLPDLSARVRTLRDRAQDISPYYRVDFATHEGGTLLRMTPDPSAGSISIVPRLQFAPDDAEGTHAQRNLEKVLAYGGSTTINGRFVESLEILDAGRLVEELRPFPDNDHLHLATPQEAAPAPVPCQLRILTTDGRSSAHLDVALTTRTTGRLGMSAIGTDPYGVLEAILRVNHPKDEKIRGGMELNLAPMTGQWPSAIRPVADLLIASQTHPTVEVLLAGKPVARGTADTPLPIPILAAARLVSLLDDLRQLTGVHFPTPAEVSAGDVAMLTALRDLLSCGKGTLPRGTISITFAPEGLAEAMNVIDTDNCALTLDTTWELACVGHTYPPVDVRIHSGHFLLTNRPELQAARDCGSPATARFTSAADHSIEIYRLNTDTSTG
ncbi:hypothetical protein LO762_09740 [Actinocorallia sp. API 0066]|uniref:hypothetical protein n=1 Tax=Actinocorallia sp. API 0066 TaxID=2896846 RepID=UPI001E3F759A|nr:hypothetical protein [Actinocorallia sp. API 0066]MCD0449470.1 hypothetical protein [Actinocorallia sp. API 0066]